jgi:hypothetical protein
MVAQDRHDLSAATKLFQLTLERSRLRSDLRDIAGDLCNLAETALAAGDNGLASAYLRELADLESDLPENFARYQMIGSEIILALRGDDPHMAAELAVEYQRLAERTSNQAEYATATLALGAAAALNHEFIEAARHFGEGTTMRLMIGIQPSLIDCLIVNEWLPLTERSLERKTFREQWKSGALAAATRGVPT